MEGLKLEGENYNRAANTIGDVNLSIDLFLEKFKKLQENFNCITDQNLNEKLLRIVEVIDVFMDQNPVDIKSHNQTAVSFDLKDQYIKNIYVCEACDLEIGKRFKEIRKHIIDQKHNKCVCEKKVKDIEKIKENLPLSNIQLQSNVNANQTKPLMKIATEEILKKDKLSQINDASKNPEKSACKKEIRKAQRKANMRPENLPKKARNFFAHDFSHFLANRFLMGNKFKNIPDYDKLSCTLREAILPVFPDAKLHYFGSRINGLGTEHSDLDIFLNIGNSYHKYDENQMEITSKVRKVKEILEKSKYWKSFVLVPTARVPILKAFNIPLQIDCDIACSNGLGPCNTQLMKYYFELQPLCHKMCLFLKHWIILVQLKTSFTCYAMTLMVVFYLQTKSILPPVRVLQEKIQEPLMIGPWQGDFVPMQLKELGIEKADDSYKNVKFHLNEFFKYYLNFNYKNHIVCPYLGEIIEKGVFNTELNPLRRYFEYYKLNRDQNSFQLDKIMCVNDPLEQNHNVAKGMSDKLLNLLLNYYKLTVNEFEINK